MRARLSAAAVAICGLLAATPLANPQDPFVLALGAPVERSLARGDSQVFLVSLNVGEFVRLMVEQHGIDVAVFVRDPQGSTISLFDNNFTGGGTEDIEIAPATAGQYSIVVTSAPGAADVGAYVIHIHERRSATSADRVMQHALTILAEGLRLNDAGRLEDARQHYEQALAFAELARGKDSLEAMRIVFDLGANALERRDNLHAQAFLQRALNVLDRTVGERDPFDAVVRSRLAQFYERLGQRPMAESLARQANDVFEETLGHDHIWYVRNLVTLANLRDDAGDIEKSEEIARRAMAIAESIHQDNTLTYAGLLNNLGSLYREKADYAHADEYLQRALEMGERLRGPDSFYVSTTLLNLGIVARERKDYATAKAYELRGLAIRERLQGPNSPDVALLLLNLANVYRSMGEVQTSIDTQLRALHIWEATGGPYERGTLISAGNLARAYAGIDDLPHAIEFQRRADSLVELQLSLDLSVGSERERLASARAMAERTDRTISLNLDLAPASQEAASLAALALLQRKGRVLDAMADTFATVRRHAEPRDITLLDELHTTNAQLSQAGLMLQPDGPPEQRRQRIKDLETKKERLEQELSAHSAELRAQLLPVTLAAVKAAIPDDAALVEFAVFRPFNPKTEHNAEAYAPPHYAAYVLRMHEAPVGVDLGLAKPIETTVATFREALRDPRCRDAHGIGRALGRQLMDPLRAAIGDATRLLVAPDGALNLVPFEAFVGDDDHYLIERYAITYLTSGRDLLRLQVPRLSQSRAVIVANPLFGEPPRVATGGDGDVRSPNGSDGSLYFAPLPSAAIEARAIKTLFPDATLVTGKDATEARLEQLNAPSVLHIASHGFFLDKPGLDNPLLRSGLALAGANLTHVNDTEDGILTALEAAGLNLWGTKLVTLSACDTGVGVVRNGEGVYGLRRAFVLAGTETLVMSLWPVSDRVTRETMTAYYTGLRSGAGRGDALRQAKLAILAQSAWSHPYYWASFIQSGEWGNLAGKR